MRNLIKSTHAKQCFFNWILGWFSILDGLVQILSFGTYESFFVVRMGLYLFSRRN
jgi:hypothetical protein